MQIIPLLKSHRPWAAAGSQSFPPALVLLLASLAVDVGGGRF